MRTASLTASLAASSLLFLAGCGGGSDAGGGTADAAASEAPDGVTVVATEFAFEPANLSLPADQATDVTLDNQGVVEHDIVVDDLDLRIHADPASSTTESVTLAGGTYTFYCSIPGHRQSGMEGTLTVE